MFVTYQRFPGMNFMTSTPQENTPQLILVLGMHRSGTSAVTRGVECLGFQLGDNLMPAASGNNEKGFWEDLDVNKLNIRLMQAMKYEWHSLPSAHHIDMGRQDIADLKLEAIAMLRGKLVKYPRFALKDPRICRLLPFWEEVFTHLGIEVGYIVASRNPMSVVRSLQKRDGFISEKGYLLWQGHMLDALHAIEGKRAVVVDYDNLLTHPEQQLQRMARALSANVQRDSESYKKYAADFLDTSLRHDLRSAEDIQIDPHAPPGAYDLYKLLLDLACDRHSTSAPEIHERLASLSGNWKATDYYLEILQQHDSATRQLRLEAQKAAKNADDLKNKYDETQGELKRASLENAELKRKSLELQKSIDSRALASKQDQARIAGLEQELRAQRQKYIALNDDYQKSTSWKITAPLRATGRLASRARKLKALIPFLLQRENGLSTFLRKAYFIYRTEGLKGVRSRLIRLSAEHSLLGSALSRAATAPKASPSQATPPPEAAPGKERWTVLQAPDAFSQQDCPFKMAVVVHTFHMDVVPTILEKLRNITATCDFIFTVPGDRYQELSSLLASSGLERYRAIEVENGGYDILPFLRCLPLLMEGGYELVCKLHTKKGLANLEEVFPNAGNVWFDMLVNPILGSQESVRQVFHAFTSNNDIAMIGSADVYKNTRWLMHGNEQELAKLLQSISPSLDPANSWGFFAGSIFWARTSVFNPILKLLPDLIKAPSLEPGKTGSSSSCWHAMERVFGVLPRINGLKTAVSYSGDSEGNQSRISLVDRSPICNGNPYPIGHTIAGYISLAGSEKALKASKHFSEQFYIKHYPHVSELKIPPLTHYLKYGVYETLNPNENFSSAWYWEANQDVFAKRMNPLVHYALHGSKGGRNIFPAQENIDAIIGIIKNSRYFDKSYYAAENPDIQRNRLAPSLHFCAHGWKERRQPTSPLHFDMIWYESEYISNWRQPINPLLHYECCKDQRKLLTRPKLKKPIDRPTPSLSESTGAPRRVCLFAGYDRDGIVDDYVVDFISELKNHSDVFYLADNEMLPDELKKLEGLTKGAWAFRHGEYDFGSYSRLARDLVGWDSIRKYDELLLVNDSSYLLSSLTPIFQKMDNIQCDWWGLQATKGISATRNAPSNRFPEKIPMQKVIEELLTKFEEDAQYDFLFGSYFLAFRQKALEKNGVLEQTLNSVRREISKKNIILRYEIGLTRRLILAGYTPASFIDHLYPFHPIYTNYHFDLIRDGFPLFKRFFLTENHYHVPELWRWKERLTEILPKTDTTVIEKNLLRVSDAEKLYNSLHVPANSEIWPEPLLDDAQFAREDLKTPKDDFYWAFPVCAYDHSFGGNDRLLFEQVKNDPKIRKVILTRSKNIQVDGVNVEVLPLHSRAGQKSLMQARYIFLKHAPRINSIYPLDSKLHRFINLWHGIPLKRIGYASLDNISYLLPISAEHARCHAVICSSKLDRLAMAAAFYPLTFHDMWITGLPRNDMILRPEEMLPKDMQSQLARLREVISGRKLILFAPTFRNAQKEAYYHFSDSEIQQLSECLSRHGAVLGVREHMADAAQSYSANLKKLDMPLIDLGRRYFPDIELLYRESDILITDYSSCFIDFMLTGKPEICFAYDLEEYSTNERGLFYDLDSVFPGPICEDFPSLLASLENALAGHSCSVEHEYESKRRLFFDNIDDKNSQRVVEKILSDIGTSPL